MNYQRKKFIDYNEKIKQVITEEELFSLWKIKELFTGSYRKGKEDISIVIDHLNSVFISDGVVCKEEWGKHKKILFILKEAYSKEDENDWNLATEHLANRAPWSSIWKRVVEWTYGINNTDENRIAKYFPDKISFESNNMWLRSIAVMNIKKSNGVSNSCHEEILKYAEQDKEELKKQIELIDPDIIVCGATISALNLIFENEIKNDNNRCDNWFYYSEINGRKRLVLDYYHPANYYPALLNYYGITNIYQQALKANKFVEGMK